MENFNFNVANDRPVSGTVARTFVSSVFSWMATALAITAIVAYQFGNTAEYMRLLISPEKGGLTILGYIVMFAPLIFVFGISAGFNRLSYPVLMGIFLLFSVLMGMSLSFIFLVYTSASIYQTFAVSAGMFGLMAFVGYTTKTDLTKMGALLFMGLIGIIIASIINIFLRSSGMEYIISFLGVIIFTGLTAYDMQKIKTIGQQTQEGTETAAKLSIMGALTLYMDFINLFIMMLRLFGGRRSE
jgi:uncharacterized protein